MEKESYTLILTKQEIENLINNFECLSNEFGGLDYEDLQILEKLQKLLTNN